MNRQLYLRQILFIIVLGLLLASSAQGQTAQTAPSPATPAANPSDVDSVEHIVGALYDTISGPAGPRNWDRFRSLFYTGARLIPSRRDEAGKVSASSLTAEQYME